MKNIILVGAGGFFLELLEYLNDDISRNNAADWRIKGFLDDARHDSLVEGVACLGEIKAYSPQPEDVFLITIGNPVIRDAIFCDLKSKKGSFLTYVHRTAVISPSAKLAEGAVICPFSIVNAHAVIRDNAIINVHCSIGHGAEVGKSCVLSPFSALSGDSSLGELCFMGTRGTLFPGVSVGDKGIIDSHSVVKSDVEAKSIVSSRADYKVLKNRMI